MRTYRDGRPCVVRIVQSELDSMPVGMEICVHPKDMGSDHAYRQTLIWFGMTFEIFGLFSRPATNEQWSHMLRPWNYAPMTDEEMGDDSLWRELDKEAHREDEAAWWKDGMREVANVLGVPWTGAKHEGTDVLVKAQEVVSEIARLRREGEDMTDAQTQRLFPEVMRTSTGYWLVRWNQEQWIQWPIGRPATREDCFGSVNDSMIREASRLTGEET